jgi:hypothetical protein
MVRVAGVSLALLLFPTEIGQCPGFGKHGTRSRLRAFGREPPHGRSFPIRWDTPVLSTRASILSLLATNSIYLNRTQLEKSAGNYRETFEGNDREPLQ